MKDSLAVCRYALVTRGGWSGCQRVIVTTDSDRNRYFVKRRQQCPSFLVIYSLVSQWMGSRRQLLRVCILLSLSMNLSLGGVGKYRKFSKNSVSINTEGFRRSQGLLSSYLPAVWAPYCGSCCVLTSSFGVVCYISSSFCYVVTLL